LAVGLLAIPRLGGTTLIDGVHTTVTTAQASVHWRPSGRYLVIGNRCRDTLVLPQGELDIFDVDTHGRLTYSLGEVRYPFAREIVEAASISRLSEILR